MHSDTNPTSVMTHKLSKGMVVNHNGMLLTVASKYRWNGNPAKMTVTLVDAAGTKYQMDTNYARRWTVVG